MRRKIRIRNVENPERDSILEDLFQWDWEDKWTDYDRWGDWKDYIEWKENPERIRDEKISEILGEKKNTTLGDLFPENLKIVPYICDMEQSVEYIRENFNHEYLGLYSDFQRMVSDYMADQEIKSINENKEV